MTRRSPAPPPIFPLASASPLCRKPARMSKRFIGTPVVQAGCISQRCACTRPPTHPSHTMLTRRFKSTPRDRLELTRPLARRAVGAIGTAAVMSAGFLVFGPFSDLSTLQLAAGPRATGTGNTPAPIVLARTGRSCGATAERRQAAAVGPDRKSRPQRRRPRPVSAGPALSSWCAPGRPPPAPPAAQTAAPASPRAHTSLPPSAGSSRCRECVSAPRGGCS